MLVASRNGTVQINGSGVGMTRDVRVDGQYLLERLEALDEASFQTRYSMLVTGPFPISEYQATIALTQLSGDRGALQWTGSFVPTGDTENEAAEAIRAVYLEGIALMQGRFGE
jgi:Polyketide cyclase / dehydrase and lipid transport